MTVFVRYLHEHDHDHFHCQCGSGSSSTCCWCWWWFSYLRCNTSIRIWYIIDHRCSNGFVPISQQVVIDETNDINKTDDINQCMIEWKLIGYPTILPKPIKTKPFASFHFHRDYCKIIFRRWTMHLFTIDGLHEARRSIAITGATLLVPCHVVRYLQLIWRSGTGRSHLWVPDLQVRYNDWT